MGKKDKYTSKDAAKDTKVSEKEAAKAWKRAKEDDKKK